MRSLALYNSYCLRLTAMLGALAAVAVFAYGALLLMAVAHAAKLSHAEDSIRAVAAQTSTLESQYLAAQNTLTLARATALGFVQPRESSVVYAASTDVLTVNR